MSKTVRKNSPELGSEAKLWLRDYDGAYNDLVKAAEISENGEKEFTVGEKYE